MTNNPNFLPKEKKQQQQKYKIRKCPMWNGKKRGKKIYLLMVEKSNQKNRKLNIYEPNEIISLLKGSKKILFFFSYT